jgi:hypothetical protein
MVEMNLVSKNAFHFEINKSGNTTKNSPHSKKLTSRRIGSVDQVTNAGPQKTNQQTF